MSEYGIRPGGVVHVGAHQGNEISTYKKNGIKKVVFIEANPNLASGLRDRFTGQADVTVIEAAASDTEGRATLYNQYGPVQFTATPERTFPPLSKNKSGPLYPGSDGSTRRSIAGSR